MDIEIKSHEILIYTNKSIAEKLGAKYMSGNKYKLPKTIEAVKDLYNVEPTRELAELYERMSKVREKFLTIKTREDALELIEKHPKLRPYQRSDVAFLKKLPHALMANQQRTGKSPTSLSLFEEEGRKKNCIVCPASLIINWTKEVRAWTDKTPYPVLGTPKKKKQVYDSFRSAEEGYLIVSYETLRKDVEIIENL